MQERRVVITGMGAVSPLGNATSMWQNLKRGVSGIRYDESLGEHTPVKTVGSAQDFHPEKWISPKDLRRMPRVSQMAVCAAEDARMDAKLEKAELEAMQSRAATVVGTTMGPHVLAETLTTAYRQNGHKRPNPIAFANCLPNMPAYYVSHTLRLLGSINTLSAACATGTQSIGMAFDMIQHDRADIIFAGGTEAILIDYVIAGFASMNALAKDYEERPEMASRPFDATRNGFVLSEGSGILVLEELTHAQRRGARIYAEVLGFGSTADAYHIAIMEPTGSGMIRAMQLALDEAGLSPNDIDYINAHGTSTQTNDKLESLAIHRVFGSHANDIAISSNKSMLGHTMAAAGALEAIASVMTIQDNVVPPTINYRHPDSACDLDYVPNEAREMYVSYVLSNSFGLGGQNASLVIGRYRDSL